MNADLIAGNLLRWSLQIVVLVAAGALVPRLLRLRMPAARLAFGQIVLLTCLLIPAFRPWRQDVVTMHSAAPPVVVAAASQPASKIGPVISIPGAVLAIAAAGTLLRFGILLFGLARLRRYRVRSVPLAPASTWSAEADVRVSPDIAGPVTFGFLKPVVLVPERFRELGADMQDAILCHEILHVRRHDWLFTAGEEAIRALLWFHPAIWWLLREIQLVREEAVDREVVEIMKSRDGYIDALLLIAGAAESDLAPAPLFLRRRHLKHRVASILKEVRMSRFQSVSAFAASLTLVAAACWFITGALPLRGAPQIVSDPSGVSVNTMGAEVLMRAPIPYPPEAIVRKVQGTVVVRVKLDAAGFVTDASVLSGPEVLRKPVLRSVLDWRFSAAAAANGTEDVNVTFGTPAPGVQGYASMPSTPELGAALAGRKVRSIKFAAVSDAARAQIEARLPLHEGDTFTREKSAELSRLAQEFGGSVQLQFLDRGDDGVLVVIAGPPPNFASAPPPPPPPPPAPMRRTAAAVEPLNKVAPAYPPLAKAARVQGTVSFQATIGADGQVKELQLVTGPPLLVQAAMQAAKQWVYPPSAAGTMAPIDITFTLAE